MPFKHFSPEDLSGFLTKRQRKGQARKDSVPLKVITAPSFQMRKDKGYLTQQNLNRGPRENGSSITIPASHYQSFSRKKTASLVYIWGGIKNIKGYLSNKSEKYLLSNPSKLLTFMAHSRGETAIKMT